MHHTQYKKFAVLALLLGLGTGCMKGTVHRYETKTIPLDAQSELKLSTFPAGFPKNRMHIPYLYRSIETPKSVFFQVFIKDKEKDFGQNEHVEDIVIHSLSYQFPGQAPVQLLENYGENFWQQNHPDNTLQVPAVPYDEHWYLELHIDMTLNGEDYQFTEAIKADSTWYVAPLLLHALR